jgi:hypothetical protein
MTRCKSRRKGDVVPANLIIQLIAGVTGVNAAGTSLKDYNLGPIGLIPRPASARSRTILDSR